ncbi:hypothetical protein CSUI_007567 [Cystoisospora suis]|uniref:Uncharacterized protein n=1 Tax=Cystoisospora suis TaxID=483139 RepID=A0A2C6KNC1_9APIC|nr:hypothetical protein CSUI_007567 [Cystoisospora suis]
MDDRLIILCIIGRPTGERKGGEQRRRRRRKEQLFEISTRRDRQILAGFAFVCLSVSTVGIRKRRWTGSESLCVTP